MTPTRSAKRRTLRERANEGLRRVFGLDRYACESEVWDYERAIWLAGHRAGKREGKAEAMKATGWGEP